jgi:hypothetical protein
MGYATQLYSTSIIALISLANTVSSLFTYSGEAVVSNSANPKELF